MTPEEIRARVDSIYPRAKEDGSINVSHVAAEITLRERFGHPSYIMELDGPGKYLPTGGDDGEDQRE